MLRDVTLLPLTTASVPVSYRFFRPEIVRDADSLYTPVGHITIFGEDDEIVSLSWGRVPDPALSRAQEQLEAYRDSELVKFALPRAPVGTYYRRGIYQRCSILIARLASTGMLLST